MYFYLNALMQSTFLEFFLYPVENFIIYLLFYYLKDVLNLRTPMLKNIIKKYLVSKGFHSVNEFLDCIYYYYTI